MPSTYNVIEMGYPDCSDGQHDTAKDMAHKGVILAPCWAGVAELYVVGHPLRGGPHNVPE